MIGHTTRRHALALVLVLVLGTGIFAGGIRSEFLWDDVSIIVNNAHIRDLNTVWRAFTVGYWLRVQADDPENVPRAYRPVAELSFAVDWALWGENVVGYHALSIALHATNCVLVYFLALQIFGNIRWSLLCALLFAAHPIHVESVVWANERSGLLAFFFVLVGTLGFIRFVEAPRAHRPWHLYIAAIVSSALALGAKGSAIALPLLLALWVWRFSPRGALRERLLAVAPIVGVVVAFFALDSFTPKQEPFVDLTPHQHMLTVVMSVGTYLRLLVLPLDLCIWHNFVVPDSVLRPTVLKAAAWDVAFLAGLVVAYRRSNVAFFALAWLAVSMGPLSNLVPIHRPLAETRAYTPSVGFCVLLTLGLGYLARIAARRLSSGWAAWAPLGFGATRSVCN